MHACAKAHNGALVGVSIDDHVTVGIFEVRAHHTGIAIALPGDSGANAASGAHGLELGAVVHLAERDLFEGSFFIAIEGVHVDSLGNTGYGVEVRVVALERLVGSRSMKLIQAARKAGLTFSKDG